MNAETKDMGDFPICFAARNQLQALHLPAAQPRAFAMRRGLPQATRRAQGMDPDQLGAVEPFYGQPDSGADRERAGRARISGDVRRNGEAAPDAVIAAAFEDFAMTLVQLDERAELAPAEARIGASAGVVHRIVGRVAASKKLLYPMIRIIIDADEAATRIDQARMLEQGEIIEAQFEGDLAQQLAKLRQVSAAVRGFSEPVAEPSHRSHRARAALLRAKPVPPCPPSVAEVCG